MQLKKLQGTKIIFCANTELVIKISSFKEFPVPCWVITKVNKWVKNTNSTVSKTGSSFRIGTNKNMSWIEKTI